MSQRLPDSEADEFIEIDTSTNRARVVEPDLITDRVKRARNDRILLSRFFAVFLLIVAVINVTPAVYHWYRWSESSPGSELPRWTYLQIFVAILHIIYAVFILQVPDWSSLKAVSVALLIIAALFGFVSAGLVVGGGNGAVASFLGLSFAMIKNATIWCVAMLLLAMLTSYLSGREAINWQRIDKIFQHIISQNSQAS